MCCCVCAFRQVWNKISFIYNTYPMKPLSIWCRRNNLSHNCIVNSRRDTTFALIFRETSATHSLCIVRMFTSSWSSNSCSTDLPGIEYVRWRDLSSSQNNLSSSQKDLSVIDGVQHSGGSTHSPLVRNFFTWTKDQVHIAIFPQVKHHHYHKIRC